MEEAEKYIKLASNQVPYSMVKRDIEEDVVPYALDNNKSILAYSPLERGLLTGKMKPGYKFNDGDHRAGVHFFKDENISRTNEFLQRIKPIAENKGLTLAQLVILWTLQQPGITIALVGARNVAQATQNAKALESNITDEEIRLINKNLQELTLVE
jgi:aryl-alcohol dehydrogenase-like predicted oxidoreductase